MSANMPNMTTSNEETSGNISIDGLNSKRTTNFEVFKKQTI